MGKVDELISQLESALKLMNINGALEAIEQLGETKNPKAVDVLSKVLKESEFREVRIKVVDALGKIRSIRTIELLIEALGDKYRSVCWTAAFTLGKIKNKKAVELLIEVLEDKSKSKEMRGNAAWTLGRIGNKRAVEPLIEALEDEFEDVRGGAALALGEIRDKKAINPLIKLLGDKEEWVRIEAAWALGKITSQLKETQLKEIITPESKEILKKAAKSEIETVQEIANKLLSKLDYLTGVLSTPYILRRSRRTEDQVPKMNSLHKRVATKKRASI